ncbi:MAG: transposase, partial [Gaiellaceae bacterium]
IQIRHSLRSSRFSGLVGRCPSSRCGSSTSDPAARRCGDQERRLRWVVERTFAWLHNRRRLLIRTDRRDDIHEGFLALACCLICWRRLETSLS